MKTNEKVEKGAEKDPNVRRNNYYVINPSVIFIENENVRDSYPEEKFEILKQSIKENGVLQPIQVKKVGERYALSHGFTRMRAVWELIAEGVEITGVKAISNIVSDEEELVRHITLNSGEPLTKFEISKILVKLQGFGWKNKDMASRLGYTEQEVSNLLTFQSQGSMEVKNAVKEGIMDINPALALIREAKNTVEQNLILDKAKEVAKSENRTKIKSNDVVSKKITFQNKFEKVLELASERKSDKLQQLQELYALLTDKNKTPESILEDFFN